jgi:hypothetical protein
MALGVILRQVVLYLFSLGDFLATYPPSRSDPISTPGLTVNTASSDSTAARCGSLFTETDLARMDTAETTAVSCRKGG